MDSEKLVLKDFCLTLIDGDRVFQQADRAS